MGQENNLLILKINYLKGVYRGFVRKLLFLLYCPRGILNNYVKDAAILNLEISIKFVNVDYVKPDLFFTETSCPQNHGKFIFGGKENSTFKHFRYRLLNDSLFLKHVDQATGVPKHITYKNISVKP